MPTLPRAGLNVVPTRPLSVAQPPRSAFEPPQPIDISPVTRLVEQITQEEQAKADTTALLAADAQLAQLHNSLLYDPDNGVLTKKGFDAAPASRAALEAFDKGASNIASGLSQNQQFAFSKIASQRAQDFDGVLARHSMSEIDQAKEDTTNANLDAERAATLQAYGDPQRVQQGIEHQRNVIALDGASRGQSKEVVAQRTAQEVSKIHAGVISLLLSDDRDIDAEKYFQAHKNELEPNALIQAKDSVDLGTARGQSQRNADAIVQRTATLGGALAEAAKIEDPKVRELTENRVRRIFEDQATSERLDREQAYQRASVILESTGDIHRIPPDVWLKLSPSEHIELQHRENQKRDPTNTGDDSLYVSLLNEAGLSDASQQQFRSRDLSVFRGKLTKQQYNHVLNLQLGMRQKSVSQVSTEAKRQAQVQERQAVKDANRAAAVEMLRKMGVDMPPAAPGAPLGSPQVRFQLSPKGKQVPQTWIDHAMKDPNYRRYLEHMGVVFDSAAVKPSVSPTTGDIILR